MNLPEPRLAGRVAVITGAGGQPGRGIAQHFAREGAILVLVDDDAAEGARSADAAGALARFVLVGPCDQARLTAAIDAAAREHGRLDILVNAAGPRGAATPLHEKTGAQFGAALERHLYEPLWAMQAAFAHMRGRGGRILNVGSIYGDNLHRYIADYAAATEALKALTRSAAAEWGNDGVLVNMLLPTVDDEAWRAYAAANAEDVEPLLSLVALERFGDPVEDIGGAALFLVSDLNGYITGHVVHADGGYHMAAPVYRPSP